ncbi:MAG: hypothetical protein IT380_11105 [Myxococcales bacterium]|nr:hypothetical protein [Myxococcales bacterium]
MRLWLVLPAALLAASGCGEKSCTSEADCQLPAVCGPDGRCAAPPPAADGVACRHDAHCQGGACLFTDGAGLCATACQSASDCTSGRCAVATDARAEGSRLRLACTAVTGDRYAAETCTGDGQCRSGICHDGHCSSPCGTCPTEFECQPATLSRAGLSLDHGVCTWWPVQPELELGAFDTPAATAASASFELPPGFDAFTLVLEDAENLVPVVTRLVGPDGTVLIGNPQPADAGSLDLARCSSSPGTATVLVPGTDDPRGAARPGRYQLEFVTYQAAGFPLMPTRASGRVERLAAALKRRAPGGVVDVWIHMAPEVGYSVADGGGTWVRTLLSRFDAVARDKLGVALGQVRMDLLPLDAGVTIDSSTESRALWAAYSVGAPASRMINVMVVDELTFAGGLAGGVPGAPGVYGRPGSGITLAPLGSGPASTGVLLAHEVSHYLGLFHSTDGFLGPDLIRDTPECDDPSASGCPDARNLMFPFFPTGEPLAITDGQRGVLEGSAWLYRWLHPGACGTHDVVGLTRVPFATGTTVGAPATLSATCGGGGGPERVHLLRLEATATRLEATVTGNGFTPVLSLRQAECGGTEGACTVAGGSGTATAGVDNPAAGAWFIVVDSDADAGSYQLEVTVTP